jgi:hypothetical protein
MRDTDPKARAAQRPIDDTTREHDRPLPEHPDNPWHGIPVELLNGDGDYDKDSAGGCG